VRGEPRNNSHARAGTGKEGKSPLPFVLTLAGWTPRDAVGFAVGAVAIVSILINVLFMQSGVHPAPMFKPPEAEPKLQGTDPKHAAAPVQRIEPASALVVPKTASPRAPRTPGEIITEIQRELLRRGYYDGPVDGLYGPRTDTAIRDFERAAGLKPSTQPNEALLQAITRSPLKSSKGITGSTTASGASTVRAAMPAQPAPAPARVLAVQRALREFGYGQIRPTGVLDPDTRRAIESFERQHKLPMTGQLSEQVVRELSGATGRTLE
jgi:peptidoglycan hydrolase-like protein with peptidoglycan-binding domain